MTERLFERLRIGPKQDPLLSRLSNQEQVIVDHIAEGLTNRQIAEEMFLQVTRYKIRPRRTARTFALI